MPSKPGRRPPGAVDWSQPVNVSNTTTVSRHPQLAIGQDGRVHIVWAEEFSPGQWEIRYTSCYGNSCNPPESLSIASAESCQPLPKQQDWPAIAVDSGWHCWDRLECGGQIAYTISKTGETPAASPVICFAPAQGPNPDLQPRLAAGEAGPVLTGLRDRQPGNQRTHPSAGDRSGRSGAGNRDRPGPRPGDLPQRGWPAPCLVHA